jgi:hypothetical protein
LLPDESARELIMSNPHDSADFHQDELQFDEAEFTEPAHAVTTCAACQTPIADLYYEAAGKIVCDPCRQRIEATFHGGSRLGRAFKALIMGTIAAAAGAVLFYAISKITGGGWTGLVAIFAGLMVGGAVKAGSGNRGGWFYQLMALFLTYSAIVAMLLPGVIEAFQEKEKKDRAQLEEIFRKARVEAKAELKKNGDKREPIGPKSKDARDAIAKVDPGKAKVADKTQVPSAAPKAPAAADPKTGQTVDPATKPAAPKEALEPADRMDNIEAEDDADEEPQIFDRNLNAGRNPAFLFVMIVAGIVAAYSLPVLNAIHLPISGFIFAFALWEAWKLNRKVRLMINGPFHLAADQPLDLAAEDLDDER